MLLVSSVASFSPFYHCLNEGSSVFARDFGICLPKNYSSLVLPGEGPIEVKLNLKMLEVSVWC